MRETEELIFGLSEPANLVAVTPITTTTPPSLAILEPSPGEVGFAQRFQDQWGEFTRFDANRAQWMTWTGTHWQQDDTGAVIENMKKVADNILNMEVPSLRQASHAKDDYYDVMSRVRLAEGHKLHNKATIYASLALAQSMPQLVTRTADYDADPMLFNCLSGTVDLRDGSIRPHNKLDYMTQMGRTPIDSVDSDCPQWKQFLLDVMRGDMQMVDYLQRLLGYTLTGDTSDQSFAMLYGNGANGKSTYINVVQYIMGDYAKTADFNTFLDLNRGAAPRNDLAGMVGKRLVVASEGAEGKSLDESVLKQFCGSDTVTARQLHKEFFEFRPVAKIMLATNHKPVVRGTDEGIWRRMRLIPFLACFTAANRDPMMEAKLKTEAPAILRWMVQGTQLWKTYGLGMPEAVRDATSQYRSSMDVFQTFLDERCTTERTARVNSQELYENYTNWCGTAGIRIPMKQAGFNQRLEERGFIRQKSNGRNLWTGLKLGATGDAGGVPVVTAVPASVAISTVAPVASAVASVAVPVVAAAPAVSDLATRQDGDLDFGL
jgi:putative DNA primase/helicase